MNVSSAQLIANINDLIFEWQKKGLVVDSRNHRAFRKSKNISEVTWGNDGYVLKGEVFSSISEYCALIDNQQYSMLLNDGSMFQFSYQLKRDEVVKHRLCWYPAPIDISLEEIESIGIVNSILGRMEQGDTDKFISRSPIRFDFSPDEMTGDHPSVHMHISDENCRIPVKSPLCLKKFMTFIVSNFYSESKGVRELYDTAATFPGVDTLLETDKRKLHMNFFEMM